MRTLARRLALPAAALSAALALTACQSDGSTSAAATAPPAASTAAPAKAAPAKDAPATEAPAKEAPAKDAPTAGHPTAAPGSAAKPPVAKPVGTRTSSRPSACTTATAKIVVSKVSRPVNHLALTVTNTGSRPCDALGAPFVGFDYSQAPIRIVEDSKPQAVVTLAPGESAYASLILTGEPGPDTHGTTVKTIKVYLTPDSGTTVTAPKGTYADDGAAVSYWQRNLEDALMY
ncbi:hypothetical protein SLA_3238 [Streptomyces laurentii]|uniref:DUF4232 domain-containing protein n=1 Tax=Streptomyces laurentii TaxID=39478 RepID=A0A161JW58_STRLU|nr:hypothetical protein SLA_3238 [Streptomyces laurentii]